VDKYSFPDRLIGGPVTGRPSESGFSLVEALIATLVLSFGLVSVVQLQAMATLMHADARAVSASTFEAQDKIDELVKLNHSTDPTVQITPTNTDSLATNVNNYFDTPQNGITRRWRVTAGPAANTRIVTVRVINVRVPGRPIDVTTILRQW
jgi:Tfp pilus assembly protein PilV